MHGAGAYLPRSILDHAAVALGAVILSRFTQSDRDSAAAQQAMAATAAHHSKAEEDARQDDQSRPWLQKHARIRDQGHEETKHASQDCR